MSSQIIFFKKNKADITNSSAVATASESNLYAPMVLARSASTGWMTTGSVDSNNTTMTIDMADLHTLTDILLVKHNFKSFTIKYWNGSVYTDFSPAINVSGSTASSSRFTFGSIQTSRVLLMITGTQVPNSEKQLRQFILTENLGQLSAWPIIKKPTHNRNKRANTMLSGKLNIAENVGAFSCDLQVTYWKSDADLTLVETLYNSASGFLVWLSGGDQAQFTSVRQGYRLEDIYLMKTTNNYIPEWYQGLYSTGLGLTISLAEVVT